MGADLDALGLNWEGGLGANGDVSGLASSIGTSS